MAPETIVAVVAQKTRLKTKKLASVYPSAGEAMNSLKWRKRSRFGLPMSPKRVSSPIMSV